VEKRIIFRLPDGLYKQALDTIKRGKAKNPSELMRKALQEFLRKTVLDGNE
jgi:Arc/MetJ-type ribon-helix-helix transcriptional regulator